MYGILEAKLGGAQLPSLPLGHSLEETMGEPLTRAVRLYQDQFGRRVSFSVKWNGRQILGNTQIQKFWSD